MVEDDLSLRSALSNNLTLAGYKPHLVKSGEETIAACGRQNFASIISDINLPGIRLKTTGAWLYG